MHSKGGREGERHEGHACSRWVCLRFERQPREHPSLRSAAELAAAWRAHLCELRRHISGAGATGAQCGETAQRCAGAAAQPHVAIRGRVLHRRCRLLHEAQRLHVRVPAQLGRAECCRSCAVRGQLQQAPGVAVAGAAAQRPHRILALRRLLLLLLGRQRCREGLHLGRGGPLGQPVGQLLPAWTDRDNGWVDAEPASRPGASGEPLTAGRG